MKKTLTVLLGLIFVLTNVLSTLTVSADDSTKNAFELVQPQTYNIIDEESVTHATDGPEGFKNYLYPVYWRTITYKDLVFDSAPAEFILYAACGHSSQVGATCKVKVDGVLIAEFETTTITSYTSPLELCAEVSGIEAGTHDVTLTFGTKTFNYFGFKFIKGDSDVQPDIGQDSEYRDPFAWVKPETYDDISGSSLKIEQRPVSGEKYISYSSKGNYLCYKNFKFDKNPSFIDVRLGGDVGYNGTVDLYLDSINGTKIASVTSDAKYTSWGTGENYRAEITEAYINGIYDVYIVFADNGVNFHGFKFLSDFEYKNVNEWIYPSSEDGVTNYSEFGIFKNNNTQYATNATSGCMLVFKNCCFSQSPDYVEIILGNRAQKTGTVEVRLDSPDGDLIASFDVSGEDNTYSSGRHYVQPAKLYFYRGHDIYIKWKASGINFFGIKFHQKDFLDVTFDDYNKAVNVASSKDIPQSVVITAAYNNDDEVLNTVIKEQAHMNGIGIYSNVSSLDFATSQYFKVFLWKNLDTMEPLKNNNVFKND